MPDYTDLSRFAREFSLDAGELLLSYYGKITSRTQKSGRGDFVTEADHAVENFFREKLERSFPTHNLLSEECGWVKNDPTAPTWVLDPVDGTRNFAQGIPTFAISLGCVIDSQPTLGVIYDPCHGHLYSAVRGHGAFLNDDPIQVSDTPDLIDALISVSWAPNRPDQDAFIRTMEKVNRFTTYYRRIGSAAMVLSYVACGKFDGYIQAGINPWDIAAGIVLVEEAGGVISDFGGNPVNTLQKDINLLAANPEVHALILKEVRPGN